MSRFKAIPGKGNRPKSGTSHGISERKKDGPCRWNTGFPSRAVVKNPPARAGGKRDSGSSPQSGRSSGEKK